MKFLLYILLALLCAFTQTPSLTGKWEGYFKASDGDSLKLQYTFLVSGKELAGTALFPDGIILKLQNGIYKESVLTFIVSGENKTSSNVGKYNGNSIELDASASDGNVYHLTLMRVK